VYEVIAGARSESENYGYTRWLAKHLKLQHQSTSVGFQHGWMWWDITDGPFQEKGIYGLDPNWTRHTALLVQDNAVLEAVEKAGKPAYACGLPFLNYFDNDRPEQARDRDLLFVPTHSNSSKKQSDIVLESIRRAKDKYKGSVLLAWEDRHLEPEVSQWFEVEIGAGDLEINSFSRIAKVFQRYDKVVTDTMGSHILYARYAGAKVSLDAELFRPEKFSLDYIQNRLPGLVADEPILWELPELASCEPLQIAKYFGWDCNAKCE
jgi:hypothetical protein